MTTTSTSGPSGGLDRWDRCWPALAAGLSLLLTLPRLTRREVWLDEALTVGASTDLVGTVRGTGGTMVLYYVLVWPVAQLSTERFWLRLPSALFVAATVVVTYLIGRRIGGRFVAVAASLVLASSWALARWGMEARSYGLAMLLVSLAWLGLIAATTADDERLRRRWWLVFAVATVLAPLAHGLAALQFPVQVVALLARPDRRAWLRRSVPVGVAWLVVGVSLFAIGAGEVADWIEPFRLRHLLSLYWVLVGRGWLGLIIGALLLTGTVGALVHVRRGAGREDVTDDDAEPVWGLAAQEAWLGLVGVLWAWGLPVLLVLISLFRPYQISRYFLTSLPGVALVVAMGITAFRNRWRLVVLAVAVVSLLSMQPAATKLARENWPGAVEVIAAEGADGDALLIRPILRAPFDYASGELGYPTDLVPLDPVDPLGPPKRFYRSPSGSMRDTLLRADQSTVWVVTRGHATRGDLEELGADPAVAARFDLTQVRRLDGGLAVYRFDRREVNR